MSSSAPVTPEVMLTDRSGAPEDGTMIRTPLGEPDVRVVLMGTLAQVLVRGARTYVQSLIGLLVIGLAGAPIAAGFGAVIPPGDFLAALKVAAGLALAPTVVALLQNAAELLARADASLPKWRA